MSIATSPKPEDIIIRDRLLDAGYTRTLVKKCGQAIYIYSQYDFYDKIDLDNFIVGLMEELEVKIVYEPILTKKAFHMERLYMYACSKFKKSPGPDLYFGVDRVGRYFE